MNIPITIEIQIVDLNGVKNPIENIVFGFRIIEHEDSCYTSSFFKSDKEGNIRITQEDFLNSTELKWESDLSDLKISRVEVYVLEPQATSRIRLSSKNYNDITTNRIELENYLLKGGFSQDNIENGKKAIEKVALGQLSTHELFMNAKNDEVKIVTDKLEDVWGNSSPKKYTFIII